MRGIPIHNSSICEVDDDGHLLLLSIIPRNNFDIVFVFCRNAHLEIIFVEMRSLFFKQMRFRFDSFKIVIREEN